MAWTATKTWVTGDPWTGPDANNYLREDMVLLRGDPQWLYPDISLNGWTNFGGGLVACSYRMVGNVVQIRGTVCQGSGLVTIATQTPPTTDVLFTLLPGYRPRLNAAFMVVSNGVIGSINIWNTGKVAMVAGSSVYFALDSISFSTQ